MATSHSAFLLIHSSLSDPDGELGGVKSDCLFKKEKEGLIYAQFLVVHEQ